MSDPFNIQFNSERSVRKMSMMKTMRGAAIAAGLLGALLLGLSTQGSAAEAEGKDILDVLQLAETTSGPGQFAFPLFAPIDLGSGYEDRIAPFVVLSNPAPNEVDVPIDASIVISLADYGSGVDGSTVAMFLNDQKVTPNVTSGTDNNIDVKYQSAEPFEYAKEIRVAVSAGDFAQNMMNPSVFSFTTCTDQTKRPTISISTNKTVFMDGQLMVLLASLKNPTAEAIAVRAYVAIKFGDSLMFYPSFTTVATPIDLVLPAGFEMNPTVIWTAPLFGVPAGSYTWFAALENTETGELGQISSSQFDFVSTE